MQDRKDEDLVYMFAYVNGFLEDATVDNAVIDVNGFGINVRISADTASRLPGIGEEVRLYTYTYVKEDAFLLYGFLSRSDLEMFKLCITVSGIGPKGALAILSVMDADSLRFAIMSGDAKAISRAPGVGARTAQRLILELKDKICMDVGASTGGFTDCMLQNGAVKVYSIDVGYGQLDWKLRNDPRVVCMEKTNIRYVLPEDLQEPAQFSSIDVSFISLTKVLLPVRNLLTDDGEIVCLIKPQFEAGREKVGKKGVVRDPAVHLEVIEKVIAYASTIAMEPCHLSFSPIKGPEGNIEYLLHLKKRPEGEVIQSSLEVTPEAVVQEAHSQLD